MLAITYADVNRQELLVTQARSQHCTARGLLLGLLELVMRHTHTDRAKQTTNRKCRTPASAMVRLLYANKGVFIQTPTAFNYPTIQPFYHSTTLPSASSCYALFRRQCRPVARK